MPEVTAGAAASRWCPQCLAGDASVIQGELGGPWRKQWHLPAVFICPKHMTLLSDRCGVCLRTTAEQTPPCTIGRATDPQLHPLQCRTTIGTTLQKVPDALVLRKHACGARLTDTSAPLLDVLDMRRLLKLQRELLRYIESDGTSTQPKVLGRAVGPLQYFVDTALTAGLVPLRHGRSAGNSSRLRRPWPQLAPTPTQQRTSRSRS
ncbi:TniQ family protein [Streptosporangium sp. G11]|uniref:TniQ family protein n=1 Tax=Streptosporangium sp. G11 TaxID=3436926 RepID=UPI003EB6BDC2